MRNLGRILTGLLIVLAAGGLFTGRAALADTIFLEDGRTLQADRVQVLGDRVRIEREGQETIDLPKSRVLSVHPPRPSPPRVPPPPAIYPNFVQEMTNEVRGQLNAGTNAGPRVR